MAKKAGTANRVRESAATPAVRWPASTKAAAVWQRTTAAVQTTRSRSTSSRRPGAAAGAASEPWSSVLAVAVALMPRSEQPPGYTKRAAT